MPYFVGIDIGGTNVEIGILDSNGNILGKTSIKTESKKGAHDTFTRIWNTTKLLCEKLSIKEQDIEAIGMGIPGPVINNSVVKIAANFSWQDNFPAKELMETISSKSVKVGNDVKVIALGETLFGAGRGYKNSITIPIGTGIAAGLIIDGKILEGLDGAAGEFGHVVVNKHGYKCGCGLTGCLETYCSATGIVREAKRRLQENTDNALYTLINGDLDKVEAKHIFDLAKQKDPFCLDIMEFFCDKLAQGVGMIVNIINPEVIIFTGGVSKAGQIMIDTMKKYLPNYALRMTLDNIVFKFGELEEEAGIKGAAALVMNK